MAAKLTRLTHKIAIQLRLVAESCTICSSRSRRLVRKLSDTPSYVNMSRSSPAILWVLGEKILCSIALSVAGIVKERPEATGARVSATTA
jgi:hypothetical protein